jgi:non-heme chloroperoxidase
LRHAADAPDRRSTPFVAAVLHAEVEADVWRRSSLDLEDAVHVGHPTGGGEVTRYIGRHGTKRVAKAVLIGAVPPLMLKTAANPGGLPIEAFDGIRAGVLADRSQFFKDLAEPFYGANRPNAKVSQGVKDFFWLQGMMGGFKGATLKVYPGFAHGMCTTHKDVINADLLAFLKATRQAVA